MIEPGKRMLKRVRFLVRLQSNAGAGEGKTAAVAASEGRLRELEEELQSAGIVCEYFSMEEAMEMFSGECGSLSAEGEPLGISGQSGEALKSVQLLEGTLWITDLPEAAAFLQERGQPFLVWLHQENRNASFAGAKYMAEELWELETEYFEQIYRRCRGLPWEILITERCAVRETCEEDADSFAQIYRDPEITRYTASFYPEGAEEKEYIRKYREQCYGFYGFGVWTVLLVSTGEVIGRAGFSCREGYEEPELGYMIGRRWQGRGLAAEVCRAILVYGRRELGFERVQCFVERGNEASERLCRSLGFMEVEQVLIDGRVCGRFVAELG